jgi:3'-5' exoribonuclease
MAKLGDLFPDELAQQKAPRSKAPPAIKPDSLKAGAAARPARVYIAELVAGQEVEGIYLVSEPTMRAAKNGSKYVQGSLCDRTGSLPMRQWDASDKDFSCYTASGYVKIRGRVELYKNALQLIVFAVQDCAAADVAAEEFLPVSTRPLEEMEKELDALVDGVGDPDYQALLKAILSDAEIRPRFMKSPAATSVHHAWVSGLLEHVLSAAKTAQSIAEQRPFLDRDLLLTGVILHDIGKIEELDPGPGFTYTDVGRLCGHVSLGSLLIERFLLKLPEFPAKKRALVLHMILSHHGELEYGSPVTPATAEAIALHHIECLDAKVQGIQTLIEKDRALGNEGSWTEFARVVDGRIYKG